jgi:hypothetical protein
MARVVYSTATPELLTARAPSIFPDAPIHSTGPASPEHPRKPQKAQAVLPLSSWNRSCFSDVRSGAQIAMELDLDLADAEVEVKEET